MTDEINDTFNILGKDIHRISSKVEDEELTALVKRLSNTLKSLQMNVEEVIQYKNSEKNTITQKVCELEAKIKATHVMHESKLRKTTENWKSKYQ